MHKFLHNRWIIAGMIVILAALSGFGIYTFTKSDNTEAVAPLQTAKARNGDIRITVSGGGYLMSADRVELGFLSGGSVTNVNVQVGQKVASGEILAALDENFPRLQLAMKELALQSLVSPDALNAAEIASLNAKDAINTSLSSLQYLISRTVFNSELGLDAAMADLEEKKSLNASNDQIAAAEEAIALAQKTLISAQYYYENVYIPSVLKYTPSSEEISLARAQLRTSELALEDANLYIERLSSDEPCEDSATVGSFTSLLNQACLDIELARLALDGTKLTAPFDGLVTAVDLAVGQVVTSSPVISMATSEKFVQFFVEEADLGGLETGLPVNIIFDAYPEDVFEGVVERIDPELEIIDGTPAVSIWASIDLTNTDRVLLSGLTAEVEIVVGEATGAILIPTQALRELAPGSYAVFVVQPDQSMKLTPVTIGLRDIANIQVLSGLKAGDIVSIGIVETK